MSNFSFSHSVFKRLVLQSRKNQGLFGKGLTLYHHIILSLIDAENRNLLKTLLEKEKMLVTSIFSLFHNVYCLIKFISCPMRHLSVNVCNFDMSKILLFFRQLRFKRKKCLLPAFSSKFSNIFFCRFLQLFTTQSWLLTTPNKKNFQKHCGKRRKCC